MKPLKNERGATLATLTPPKNSTKYQQNFNPDADGAQCAKAATVRCYLLGWISLQTCSDMFRRNPLWRSA